jgi:hypothetical protein
MTETKLLHKIISEFAEDSLVIKLLKEIDMAVVYPLKSFMSSPVIHYLKELRARRPITKESIDSIPFSDSFLLKMKIKKLHGTELYQLCNEIAFIKNSCVEEVEGKFLYVFLDQYLVDGKIKKAKVKLKPANLIL